MSNRIRPTVKETKRLQALVNSFEAANIERQGIINDLRDAKSNESETISKLRAQVVELQHEVNFLNRSRPKVFADIETELEYQDDHWELEPAHSNLEFLVYLQGYVTEAFQFATKNYDGDVNEFTKHQLRKIAALAVAALYQNGSEPRKK